MSGSHRLTEYRRLRRVVRFTGALTEMYTLLSDVLKHMFTVLDLLGAAYFGVEF